MRKIVYLSPFPNDLITGGIKIMHKHVEMLAALGFEASIFSPRGKPLWMSSQARLFDGKNPALDRDNLVIFPEVLTGDIGTLARSQTLARKALLCQNQYFIFNETIPSHSLKELGFILLMTVGQVAREFLERVLAPSRFAVIPVCVDQSVFFPREKTMRIAVFPRKLPKEYALIRQIFVLKYPHFSAIPWDLIDAKSEAETSDILGRATVFLSLCERECAPLTPLEAMASGCIVVGFHGYGGMEYATDANGAWLRPDYLEETADALARVILAIEKDEPVHHAMRAAGIATAKRFSPEATQAALRATFETLAQEPRHSGSSRSVASGPMN